MKLNECGGVWGCCAIQLSPFRRAPSMTIRGEKNCCHHCHYFIRELSSTTTYELPCLVQTADEPGTPLKSLKIFTLRGPSVPQPSDFLLAAGPTRHRHGEAPGKDQVARSAKPSALVGVMGWGIRHCRRSQKHARRKTQNKMQTISPPRVRYNPARLRYFNMEQYNVEVYIGQTRDRRNMIWSDAVSD